MRLTNIWDAEIDEQQLSKTRLARTTNEYIYNKQQVALIRLKMQENKINQPGLARLKNIYNALVRSQTWYLLFHFCQNASGVDIWGGIEKGQDSNSTLESQILKVFLGLGIICDRLIYEAYYFCESSRRTDRQVSQEMCH